MNYYIYRGRWWEDGNQMCGSNNEQRQEQRIMQGGDDSDISNQNKTIKFWLQEGTETGVTVTVRGVIQARHLSNATIEFLFNGQHFPNDFRRRRRDARLAAFPEKPSACSNPPERLRYQHRGNRSTRRISSLSFGNFLSQWQPLFARWLLSDRGNAECKAVKNVSRSQWGAPLFCYQCLRITFREP